MTVGITATSTLRSLVDLIEAIDRDWPSSKTESAINKAIAESKLLKVVGATIIHDLDEIESRFRKSVHDVIRDIAIELALVDTLRSTPDQLIQLTDAVIIQALVTPTEPADVLRRIANAFKVEPPDIVQKSVRMIGDKS